ncbi:MAG: hypothetical protein Q4Q03_07740, partial [Bowdeniella nasicola]|nr:hypothetical protein [Bowdeniella nasicola]
MKQLRAHMLQPHPRLGDITTNSEAILTALSDRALAGADLVVIPRGGLTGGPLANLADDRAFQLALRDTRAALISRLGEQGENGETTYVFAADASHLWVARAGQLTALAAITPGLWQLTCANRAIAFVHSSHIARVLGTLVDLQVDLVVV